MKIPTACKSIFKRAPDFFIAWGFFTEDYEINGSMKMCQKFEYNRQYTLYKIVTRNLKVVIPSLPLLCREKRLVGIENVCLFLSPNGLGRRLVISIIALGYFNMGNTAVILFCQRSFLYPLPVLHKSLFIVDHRFYNII